MNAQVNRIFNEVGPVQIPDLTTIMHEINDRMRAFEHYDPADPRVRGPSTRSRTRCAASSRGRGHGQHALRGGPLGGQQADRIAGQLSASNTS